MKISINEEFLKYLVTIPRATGYEFPAQKEVKKYLENDVDEIYGDRVGNLYAVINIRKYFPIHATSK